MEIIRTFSVKLTKEEYRLLDAAAHLIDNIVAGINTDDFGEDYDLESISHNIYEFLEDTNVYVE